MGDEGSKSYLTAAQLWRRTPCVNVLSVLDTSIAIFPLDFLSTCGDNTWDYILFVISRLVNPDPLHPGLIVNDQGDPVDLESIPVSGDYRYLETGKTSGVSFAKGPEYFSQFLAPSGVEESTRSASSQASRSRPQQHWFREHLVGRDAGCIISRDDSSACDAAHIVPQSRPDVYKALLGHSNSVFDSSSGLLLSKTLHHSFDALKWSLYKKGDIYYVHYFAPATDKDRLYNGRPIPLSRFRQEEGLFLDAPHPDLIDWHYRQCVMERIRGFSVGMNTSR